MERKEGKSSILDRLFNTGCLISWSLNIDLKTAREGALRISKGTSVLGGGKRKCESAWHIGGLVWQPVCRGVSGAGGGGETGKK